MLAFRIIMWKQRLVALVLLSSFVLVTTAQVGLILVSSWGRIWHLFHSGPIAFHEWRVPVPKRFSPRQEGESLTLWKYGFGIPIWDAPAGDIKLFSSGSDKPFQSAVHYERFVSESLAYNDERGFRFLSQKRMSVDQTLAYCLEFVSRSQGSELEIRCMIENSSVAVWYFGDLRYVDDFWSTLQGMVQVSK